MAGPVSPGSGPGLCWSYAPEQKSHCVGCLELGPCSTATVFNRTHDGSLFSTSTRQCVDLSSTGALGAWECGHEQPNQRFVVDPYTGMIASGAADYGGEGAYAGMCASSAPSAPDSTY